MNDEQAAPEAEELRTLYRCPRCDHEQESVEEPERCPVCNFHGLPDGRWIMRVVS
jgi:rubrerythrin